jgi:hypothetical protein
VEERYELDVSSLLRSQPELVGNGDGEIDDLAAVAAGIGIVGLDDVSEEVTGLLAVESISLRFIPANSAGIRIDDVYLDPWRVG